MIFSHLFLIDSHPFCLNGNFSEINKFGQNSHSTNADEQKSYFDKRNKKVVKKNELSENEQKT